MAMFNLFENKSYNDKINVQSNLAGRTHYFGDQEMKCFSSKILYSTIKNGGLLIGVVESYSADMHNTKRLFRPVIFDVFGNVVNERLNSENGLKTKDQAKKLMWESLDNMNGKKITMAAIKQERSWHDHKLRMLRQQMKGI